MTSPQAPTVSVLMAVYDGEKYLAEAIESILQQTFSDFEFIIIDDGSTDTTQSILQRYAAMDMRIRLLRNERNQGIGDARNRAQAVARGRYIAITDADDIVMPERLHKQVAFLDAHPAVGIVGTRISMIDAAGKLLKRVADARPIHPTLVRWALFFSCCMTDPSIMMRREVYQHLQGTIPPMTMHSTTISGCVLV